MKILMINTVCGIGSTGRICTDLARNFESQGHEVKIAYRATQDLPKDCEHFGVRIGTKVGVYIHALLARLTDRAGFYQRTAKASQTAGHLSSAVLPKHPARKRESRYQHPAIFAARSAFLLDIPRCLPQAQGVISCSAIHCIYIFMERVMTRYEGSVH